MIKRLSLIFALLGVFAFATGCGGGEYEEPANIQEPGEQDQNMSD